MCNSTTTRRAVHNRRKIHRRNMVSIATLRRMYGDDAETATLARDLLAPVAGQLSGDPSDLHRRCVLGQYLGRLGDGITETVRAAFAPFGDVEAIAASRILENAVVVFRSAASAAAALREPPTEALLGHYTAVPPFASAALPLCFIQSKLIKAALYPPPSMTSTPSRTTSGAASTQQATPGTVVEPGRMWAGMQAMPQARPLIVFRNSPDEGPMIPGRGPPGTTRFVPSMDSLVYGPSAGEDGHLWMHGNNVSFFDEGFSIDRASIRVVRADLSECTSAAAPEIVFLPL